MEWLSAYALVGPEHLSIGHSKSCVSSEASWFLLGSCKNAFCFAQHNAMRCLMDTQLFSFALCFGPAYGMVPVWQVNVKYFVLKTRRYKRAEISKALTQGRQRLMNL